jgi:hypothetical protein
MPAGMRRARTPGSAVCPCSCHRDRSILRSLWFLHFLLVRECNSLSLFLPLTLSFPLNLSLSPVNRVRTPSSPVRERERERQRQRKREGEGERGRERCPELLFLSLKGMTGALAPFSYQVSKYSINSLKRRPF